MKTVKAKKYIAGLLASCFMATTLFTGAASADSITVTADRLNIRAEANAASKSIDVVSRGDEMSFVSESGSWYQVKHEGKTGYVVKSYVDLDLAELEADVVANTVAMTGSGVTTDRVNIRALPKMNASIVKVAPKQGKVEILGQCGAWYQVSYGGKTGYMMAQYLTLDSAVEQQPDVEAPVVENEAVGEQLYEVSVTGVTTARVNMRKTPSTGASIVKVIGDGDSVTIIGEDGDWYKVTSGGKEGYMVKDYVKVVAQDGSSSSDEVIYGEAVIGTATTRVNMRKTPSTGASIVKVIGVNQEVTIEGEANGWYKVTAGGREGYIVKTYLIVKTDSTGEAVVPEGFVSYPAARVGTLTARVNMRKSASTSAGIAKVLNEGSQVTVLGEQGSFYQVKYGSTAGYIAKAYVKLGATSGDNTNNSTGETIYSTTKTGVTTVIVNLREVPEGDVLHTLPADTEVTLIGESGSWYKAIYANSTGYISKSYVTEHVVSDSTPGISGDGTTAYVTANSLNVRKGPGTGYGVVKVLSYGAEVRYYSLEDGWYLIKSGEDTGYVSASYISTAKPGTAPSDPSGDVSIGQVILSDWFKGEVADVFARGDIATVTDVKTGLSFKVKRTGGNYHADAQPLTKDDTEIMYKIYSYKWQWTRRSIWVTVDGKTYAGSMNGMPHGESDSMPDNGFDGCFCIHFLNSKTHTGNRVDSAHQACVQEAYEAG